MENLTLTKLALISQRARREPKCQFTSLAHLLDEGFLKECYNGLGRDRACGMDGVCMHCRLRREFYRRALCGKSARTVL